MVKSSPKKLGRPKKAADVVKAASNVGTKPKPRLGLAQGFNPKTGGSNGPAKEPRAAGRMAAVAIKGAAAMTNPSPAKSESRAYDPHNEEDSEVCVCVCVCV